MAQPDMQPDMQQAYERWKSLVKDGHSREEAMQIVRTTPQFAKAHAIPLSPGGDGPTTSLAESGWRGGAQGMTASLGDELQGVTQAVGNRVLPESMGGRSANEPQPSFVEDYRQERDAARADNDKARASHPGAYIAGELGGALLTAPLMPAAKGLRGAAKAGTAFGAAVGLGNSRADLTKGEVGRAAADTSLGALIGLGASVGGYGILKAGGALLRSAGRAASNVIGGEQAASANAIKDIASRVADNSAAPSALKGEGTVADAFRNTEGYVKNWSDMLKEPFALPVSKATGDRAAALAEQRAQQFGPTMNQAQATQAKLVEQTGKILNMHVENIAADPAKLGRGEIADQLAKTLREHIGSLYEARSQIAGPLYDAAEKAGGGIDATGIRQVIEEQLSKTPYDSAAMNPLLKKALAVTDKAGAGGGLSIREANDLRKLMGQVLDRKAQLLSGVEMSVQQGMAHEIRGSVDAAFNATAGTSSAPGVALLRKANAAWAEGSGAIEDATTNTVEAVLKRAGTDASETIPKQLLSLQPRQVEGVFRILNAQADGTLAQNVRAQMFREVLSASGGAQPGSIAVANGVDRFAPGTAVGQFYKAEPALRAAYAGDPKALHALADTFQLLKRVTFGPNITGSPTYAYAADDAVQGMAAKGAEAAASAIGGKAAAGVTRAVFDKVGAIFSSPAGAAKAVTSVDGILAINKALRVALQSQGGAKAVPMSAAQDALKALVNAGMFEESKIGRNPQPSAPPVTDESYPQIAQQRVP